MADRCSLVKQQRLSREEDIKKLGFGQRQKELNIIMMTEILLEFRLSDFVSMLQ